MTAAPAVAPWSAKATQPIAARQSPWTTPPQTQTHLRMD
jgi:hypothetical protein